MLFRSGPPVMWLLPTFPIPAPPGTPPWINVLFGLAAVTVVIVLIWQAVRFFRDNKNDDDSH